MWSAVINLLMKMVSNKKEVSCVLNQVNEYQFTDPVPIPMRGIVVAELAAVGISFPIFFKDIQVWFERSNAGGYQLENIDSCPTEHSGGHNL